MTPVDAPGPEPAPRAAVVLVTHDTREQVVAALATLPVGLERVVVDAGSADGTAAAVRAAAPDVRVIELANVGFARAANAGVRATSAEGIVVANADVRFGPRAVPLLLEVLARDERVAAVGPRVVYPDGRPQASARRRPDLRTAMGHALLGRLLPDNRWTRRYHDRDAAADAPRDVDWLSGCVMAVRREAFEAVGGFDPGYFLYVEDVDLADRLRAAGWRLRYEPGVEVVHLVGASTRRIRGRALVWHAQSLQRYASRRLTGPLRALRPLLAVVLAAWVGLTWLLERFGPSGRSPTGERHAAPPPREAGAHAARPMDRASPAREVRP